MKIPLVGESFAIGAPGAAAQLSVNVFPEVKDDPNEKEKGVAVLRSTPGAHLLATLPNSNTEFIRGIWSGGGRVFVVSGSHLYEVGQGTYPGTPNGGVVIGSGQDLGANDGLPVQMFGNGNQLGIVANGQFYIDNGSVSGTFITANGVDLIWTSGALFTPTMAGATGTFNGASKVVQAYTSSTHILLASSVGAQASPVAFSIAGGAVKARFQLNSGVTITGGVPGASVAWASGSKFPTYTGTAIDPRPVAVTISNQPVGVATWVDDQHLTLAGPWPGSGTGVCNTFPVEPGILGPAFVALGDSVTLVSWVSGSIFTPGMVGLPFVINGLSYKVGAFMNDGNLLLTDDSAGIQTGVAWSAVQQNLALAVAGGDLVTAVTGAFLDGSFYVQRDASLPTQVNFSAVNDGTIWNGLDFFKKEGDPTATQSILADHELLYVLGVEESEVWQSNPNPPPAQVRIPGMAVREGSVARWGAVAMDETLYWISGTPRGGPVAYRMRSGVPERISTHAVEQAWATQSFTPVPGGSPVFNGTAFAYTDQGHKFWVVNFAGAEAAWVYDATASAQLGSPMWHQRRGAGGAFLPYRWWFHTYVPEWQNGTHIVGDVASGKLYELSQSFGDEDGADMTWIRTLPWRWNDGRRIYFGRMDLEMATGLTSSTTVEPVVTRDYSDDRGHNYINPQTAGTGLHNDYSRRVYWPAGGSSLGRAWRFTGSGQLPVTLISLFSDDVDGLT